MLLIHGAGALNMFSAVPLLCCLSCSAFRRILARIPLSYCLQQHSFILHCFTLLLCTVVFTSVSSSISRTHSVIRKGRISVSAHQSNLDAKESFVVHLRDLVKLTCGCPCRLHSNCSLAQLPRQRKLRKVVCHSAQAEPRILGKAWTICYCLSYLQRAVDQ